MKLWRVLTVLFFLPAVAQAATAPDEPRREPRFLVGGQAGVVIYPGGAARVTSPGAAYGLNVGWNLRRGIAFEAGYQGAAYNAQGVTGVGIVENGGQALLQVGPEVKRFYPFAAWGIGVSRLTEVGGDAPNVQDSTLVRMPVGLGLAYTVPSEGDAAISVGARGMYNFTLRSEAFPGLAQPFAANQVVSSIVVGGRF